MSEKKRKYRNPLATESWGKIYWGTVEMFEGDLPLTFYLTYLIDLQEYWVREGKVPDSDGVLFFVTAAATEEKTGISSSVISLCAKHLESLGILKAKLKGLPLKKWVYVDMDRLEFLLKSGENYPRIGENSKNSNSFGPIIPKDPVNISLGGLEPCGSLNPQPRGNQPRTSKDVTRSNAIDESIAGKQGTFLSTEASGDMVPSWVLGSLQETSLFVNMVYSPTHPSKELQGLNTILRKIRNRTFLTDHAWKAGWPENTEIDFSGLLPYDNGSETEVPWDSVIQMVLHATQTLQESWAVGFDYPKMLPGANRRQKMNLKNFLVNDRDPNNCTSMFLTFLFSPTQAQLTGAWKETRAKLPPEIAKKMDTLYRNMVLAENQPEWTFQHKQTYYSAGLELVEWYKENREAIHRSSENQFSVSNLPAFFSLICQYVESERVTNYLRWEFLTPKSPYWKPFVNLVRYQEQVELDPTRETEAVAEAREVRYQEHREKAKLSRKVEELRQMAEESGIPVPDTEELREMAKRSLARESQWELDDAGDEW